MPLERYKQKRDFGKTPEPAGEAPPPTSGRFVVQRHRATRLHYDFRLEIDGVLVSWAVPKGPTLDPKERRMAVHVEDHPIEYLDFEGVIPARQYGAGDVIVWDWGTWEPESETPDPLRAISDGELKFRLEGEKLAGRYTIVRTSGRKTGQRAFEDDESEQWLLIKKRDEASEAGWDAEDHPKSVKTGRTNDEVKAARDAYWISEAPAPVAEIDLSAAEPAKEGEPRFLEPMLATLADRPFDDDDWLFEIKWDGYRVQAVIADDAVRTFTRNGHDAATYFPRLLPAPRTWLNAETAILDGEVVALDDDGRPDFSLLQLRISQSTGGRVPGQWGKGGRGGRTPEGADADDDTRSDAARAPLVYQVFDLLHIDGRSLLKVPLESRKRLLRSILKEHPRIRFASHIEGQGKAFYKAADGLGVEGIVAKHRRSPYEPGRRTGAWLKIKLRPEQELIVGGWTSGEGNAKALGAVIVGVREFEGGPLRFAGKVGSGFDSRARTTLRERLDELASDEVPFDPPPGRRPELRGARWIRPELVIRAELGGWSRDGLVRQAAYKGIDDGRDPLTVVRESPVVATTTAAETEAALDALGGGSPIGSGARGRATGSGTADTPDDRGGGVSTDAARARRWDLQGSTVGDDDGSGGSQVAPTGTRRRPKAGQGDGDERPPEWAPANDDELAALAELPPKEARWTVGGVELKLTNLDKVLFPGRPADGVAPAEDPVTKRDLIGYFARIAPVMLPHLAERPLNLQRFPDGSEKPGFWQKDLRPTDPAWLTRWREVGVEERTANTHVVADRTATLCWLGNQAAFEVHAWTSQLPQVDRPTYALIDIDPGEATTWDETLTLARLFRTALGHLGVRGYPKLTGKRGIQIWVPVEPRYGYDETSDWVERLSRAVGQIVPELVSWEWAKGRRDGRARLDYTQNTYIKTLVAPYAVRPAPAAPVSAPIEWDELDDPTLTAQRWTIRTLPARVDEVGDLFAPAQTDRQVLPSLG